MSKEKLKVGIIAAEHSGDRLGAKLIESLQKIYDIDLYGLGGPEVNLNKIITPSGLKDQDLHVMGLIDPLIKLPKILFARRKLLKLFIKSNVDIFIGVDSPDFNMFFHKKLKSKNVKTIQLVSPSIWAWRKNRIKAIQKYIDLTMCLFQFEYDFYKKENLQSFFLGHPFNELHPGENEEILAKYELDSSKHFISILPGSRSSEIVKLMPVYIEAAKKILILNPNTFFLVPAANKNLAEIISSVDGMNEIPSNISINSAKDYLSLSSISIVTSGTASLEAAVLGNIPIICYKTSKLNYSILSRLIKTKLIGLPNLLLKEEIFPELIQSALSPNSIVASYSEILSNKDKYESHIFKMKSLIKGEGFPAAARAIKNLL
ncbi:MAG: lipid-A-disaccharide synthase [Gammaproteobacteria bacterium]|nr:lipid-A-disaccharide synthase [Gammaproteobacteria bacterium]